MNGKKLIISLLFVVCVIVIRKVWMMYIQKKYSNHDEILIKQWVNTAKNVSNLILVFGLMIVWLTELRFVALSVAAFVAAITIATKELIQCFLGSIYLAGTRIFSVGDWVKVGDYCGEVQKSDWLCTTLLEIDMDLCCYVYTGRSAIIPNNVFLANGVHNLNYMRKYTSHSFSIIRDPEKIDVCKFKQFILERAKEYCAPFSETARLINALAETKLGVPIFGPEPSVRVSTTEFGKNIFSITLYCPTHEAIRIEQKLVDDFMEYWYQQLSAKEKEKVLNSV